MFTKSISAAAQSLTQAGLEPNVVTTLMGLLGNCSQPLLHNGPIEVSSSTPDAPGFDPTGYWPEAPEQPVNRNDYPSYPFGVLTVSSTYNYNGKDNSYTGGAAAVFNGPVVINAPLFARFIFAVFNIFTFAGVVRCGKATANWSKGGGRAYVDVQECTDDTGSTVIPGGPYRVYLPKHAEMDPNVVYDDVISFFRTRGGTYMACHDYLDAKIGTLSSWGLDQGDIPPGWAMRDSIANSVANGGTGVDAVTDYCYARYNTIAGGKGGSVSYTPSGEIPDTELVHGSSTATTTSFSNRTYTSTASSVGSLTIASGTANVTISSASVGTLTCSSSYTGITRTDDTTLDPHDHEQYAPVLYDVEAGAGTTFYAYADDTIYTQEDSDLGPETTHAWRTHYHTITDVQHSHTVTGGSHTHTATDSGHTHTGTVSGTHTHDVTVLGSHWDHTHSLSIPNHTTELVFVGDPAEIRMPWVDEIPIERIDNSV